jgi:hypothetical protein
LIIGGAAGGGGLLVLVLAAALFRRHRGLHQANRRNTGGGVSNRAFSSGGNDDDNNNDDDDDALLQPPLLGTSSRLSSNLATPPTLANGFFFQGRELWQSAGRNGLDASKLFEVLRGTPEHNQVTALLLETLPMKTVDRLERVENGALHEAYKMTEKSIRNQVAQLPRGGFIPGAAAANDQLTRRLFHGTSAVEAIVNSTDGHGFLPLLAGTAVGAIYGDGTYFARGASYSDSGYARVLPNGQKQLLVVDVITGIYCKGKKGMKMCPELPGQQFARFNSLVNDVLNPTIFVVQHSGQAYPAYVITYH